ncbi:MAG: T9SS type A sorting domain-containing protein [Chitinophagaceae bacterium]|nr:T9SS type A sorting domain-containing protein [Chitinophagaceae bacterium]
MKKLFTLFVILLSIAATSRTYATIFGTPGTCVGSTTTLTDSAGATGTWTSSTPSVATVGFTSGIVSGVAVGTSVISFTGPAGLATMLFTVGAAPGPIMGSVPFCVGSSITLTNSVSGGTWALFSSGLSYYASVGATTGVVTGVHGGYPNIVYRTAPGCSVSVTVTVNETSADSIGGASTVCVGSTTTITSYLMPGTWSSSNPMVASISVTGVVTGVSAGTAIITRTTTGICGPAYATMLMTVTTTTYAGTITGASSLPVGASTLLSASVAGGTWSSASPSVATISAGGTVTGVTPGTAVISYAVSGCTGLAYATTTVTVTTTDCITGRVYFMTPYAGPVKVWLIKYNPSTLMLTATDSLVVTSLGTAGAFYSFCGMGTDSFRIKARDTSTTGFGHIPAYHNWTAFWNSANVVYHTSGVLDSGKNINMLYGAATSGPGFIAGNVTMGANKGTADAVPAVNMQMYCINNATGEIMQKTLTDAAGHYSFSNLPVGQSYKIYPELINYATTPYPPIALTSSASSMTAAHFEQHTLSHTITPIVSAVNDNTLTAEFVTVYPNPATGILNVHWSINKAVTGNISITDMAGRSLVTVDVDMNAGTGTKALSLAGIAPGIYAVRIAADGFTKNIMIQIQ